MGVCALSSAALAAVALAALAEALALAPGLVEASVALLTKGWGVLMEADFACKRARPGLGAQYRRRGARPFERSGGVGCRICGDAVAQDV